MENENIGNRDLVKRMQIYHGQRLSASALQSFDDFNRAMRWLHNQSLHQPGIGDGFAVRGEIGEREVRIEPGYAIDAEGREIVLTRTKILPVPPIAGEANNKSAIYDLTVSFPEKVSEEVETREGVCYDRGTVRLREEPDFCWVPLDPENGINAIDEQVRQGYKIVITRAEIQNCRLSKKISVAQRRNAKPAKEYYIVTGSYVPEADEWKVWSNEKLNGLKISIDIKKANFTTPLNYQAEIIGKRYVSAKNGSKNPPYLLEGFLYPVIPSSNGRPILRSFDLYILMPMVHLGYIGGADLYLNPRSFFQGSDDYRQQILSGLGWQITWIGSGE